MVRAKSTDRAEARRRHRAATAAAAGQKKPEAAPDLEKTGSFSEFKILIDEKTE